jgi:hypothetical protein
MATAPDSSHLVEAARKGRDRTRIARLVIAVLIALAIMALALWAIPGLLTLGFSNDEEERYKAMSDARTGVVALIAVTATVGTLYITARNFRATQREQEKSRLLVERGQITDRYTEAVKLLGGDSPDTSVGGIHALGKVMADNPDYEQPIVDVLCAFIRRNAKRQRDGSVPWSEDEAEHDEVKPSFRVQAAITVLRRRDPVTVPVDLRDSDLRGARMRGMNLRDATLRRANLFKAKLKDADLTGAILRNADLTEAELSGANLTEAVLSGAILIRADVNRAELSAGSLTAEQLDSVVNRAGIRWVEERKFGRPAAARQQPPD